MRAHLVGSCISRFCAIAVIRKVLQSCKDSAVPKCLPDCRAVHSISGCINTRLDQVCQHSAEHPAHSVGVKALLVAEYCALVQLLDHHSQHGVAVVRQATGIGYVHSVCQSVHKGRAQARQRPAPGIAKDCFCAAVCHQV